MAGMHRAGRGAGRAAGRAALAALLAGLAAPAPAWPGERAVDPARVLSVVTADWNGDGGFDRAVLVEGAEDADLLIYLSDGPGSAMRRAVERPGIAWRGAMWGTLPELGLNAAGSLELRSGNEAVGRHRWRETLTVAFRQGRFVVAGFTFSSHDTLEPGLTRHCDANFLSGRGLLDGMPFALPAGAVPLEAWGPEHVPPQCAAG